MPRSWLCRGRHNPFHAIKLAKNTIDSVRRRVQTDTLGHRGRRGDPLYGIRRVLLRGADRHTLTSYTRLRTSLNAGGHRGQVAAAWIATQEPRHVYGAVPHPGPGTVVHLLHRLRRRRHPRAAPPGPHHPHLADPSCSPTSHRPSEQRAHEAVNLLIKRIKRVGFGFRNFNNYRLRLLLHCGTTWSTHCTTRIRGRSPRLVS